MNPFIGTETVKYDGEIKGKGNSMVGRSYMFTVDEEGEQANYEVEFKWGLFGARYTVRRNGIAVFTS